MTRNALSVVALCAALLLPGLAIAEGGPGAIDAFRKADAGLRALTEEASDRRALREKTDALLDYRTLAMESLGGPVLFEKRCGKRCPEYTQLLTKMIRRVHLDRLQAAGKVEVLGEVVKKSVTVVKTRVHLPPVKGKARQTQRVDYVMHKVRGHWQVRDIVTDGVTLSSTYRTNFSKLADSRGIGAVIGELERRLKSPIVAP